MKMKRLKISLTVSVIVLNSLSLFASNSIFTYEKQELQSTFSELSNIESAVLNDESQLNDFIISKDSIYEAPVAMQQATDKCSKARMDAQMMYKASGPAIGTFCCTAGTNPLFGIILVAFVIQETPKDSNLGLRDYSLMTDNDYITCYRLAAFEKKKKAVWTAFGIGTAIYAAIAIYYYAVYIPSL